MKKPSRRKIVELVLAVAALIALLLLLQFVPLEGVVDWLEGLGAWGPIALAAVFVLTSMALIPGFVLNVAAGALFGLVVGSIAALVGSTIGAILSFLVARKVGRERMSRWIEGDKHVEALDKALGRAGFKVVIASRLSPGAPFNTLNYAFGVSRVSLRDFALGSLLGMIPYRFLYAYMGTAVGQASGVLPSLDGESSWLDWAVFLGGLAATVVFVIWVTRQAKRVMTEPSAGKAS